MPTKEQYDFFKSQYEEENSRNLELTKRAEIYLSVISIFLTAVLFKLADLFAILSDANTRLASIIISIALILFSISLVFIVNSLRIRNYEGVIDFDAYIQKNDDSVQENDDFFADRIADYIVAVRRNEVINDQKADMLIKARVFLLGGFLTTFIFILYLLKTRA
jgi:hypothetical protein